MVIFTSSLFSAGKQGIHREKHMNVYRECNTELHVKR